VNSITEESLFKKHFNLYWLVRGHSCSTAGETSRLCVSRIVTSMSTVKHNSEIHKMIGELNAMAYEAFSTL